MSVGFAPFPLQSPMEYNSISLSSLISILIPSHLILYQLGLILLHRASASTAIYSLRTEVTWNNHYQTLGGGGSIALSGFAIAG